MKCSDAVRGACQEFEAALGASVEAAEGEVKRSEGAVALGLEARDAKCGDAVRGACQEAPRVCVSKSTSISVSSDELRIKEACYGTTRF